MKDKGPLFTKILLTILAFLALLRLVGFTVAFGEKSLQVDFSAYYTAGESVNAHLSPYKNYLDSTPRIWDGYDTFKHSRFLYPPLVAYLFRLIALLPYHVAKYVWMYLSIISLLLAALLAFKAMNIKIDVVKGFIVLILLFTFHPLIKYLAFGEIDAITLFFMVLGVYQICNKKNKKLSGIFFAISVLLKLHNILILPFLFLRKQWKVLIGFAAGGFILTFFSLLLCGFGQTISYLTVDLPRIAIYGEGGTKDMMEPDTVVSSLNLDEGSTTKDGRVYSLARDGFNWTEYATLTQTPIGHLFQWLLLKLKLNASQTAVSIIIFIILFSIFYIKIFKGGSGNLQTQYDDFLFWQAAFLIILLSAPITWDTNTVWLITLFPVLASKLKFTSTIEQFCLIVVCLGLAVIFIPNFSLYPLVVPFGFLSNLSKYQYVIGELIIFIGFIMYPFSKNIKDPFPVDNSDRNRLLSLNS